MVQPPIKVKPLNYAVSSTRMVQPFTKFAVSSTQVVQPLIKVQPVQYKGPALIKELKEKHLVIQAINLALKLQLMTQGKTLVR